MNFGGVCAIRPEHFKVVNGFSNVYFGWGKEDNDLSYRLKVKGLKHKVVQDDFARFFSLRHVQESLVKRNQKLLKKWKLRSSQDGLNNLHYNVSEVQVKSFYTNYTVWLK